MLCLSIYFNVDPKLVALLCGNIFLLIFSIITVKGDVAQKGIQTPTVARLFHQKVERCTQEWTSKCRFLNKNGSVHFGQNGVSNFPLRFWIQAPREEPKRE